MSPDHHYRLAFDQGDTIASITRDMQEAVVVVDATNGGERGCRRRTMYNGRSHQAGAVWELKMSATGRWVVRSLSRTMAHICAMSLMTCPSSLYVHKPVLAQYRVKIWCVEPAQRAIVGLYRTKRDLLEKYYRATKASTARWPTLIQADLPQG